MPDRVSVLFTLFDDESVREKLTVMSKWDAMTDDDRNSDDLGDKVEQILQLGRTYRVTVEEVPNPDRPGTFEIWIEGWQGSGDGGTASKRGTAEGATFRDAVLTWYAAHPDANFDPDKLTYWGCRHFPTETEARRFCG